MHARSDLVKCFIDPELRRWPNIQDLYGEGLRRTKVFGPAGTAGVTGDVEEDDKHAKGETRWKVLHDRIVEHVRPPFSRRRRRRRRRRRSGLTLVPSQNIRVVAGYYTRITLSRLATFLSLSVAETEQFLSKLVTSKTVYAKIDRPAGIVSFVKPKRGDEVLNEWSSDVHKLMGLIEKSCHLIAKVRRPLLLPLCSFSVGRFADPLLLPPPLSPAGARRACGAEGAADEGMSATQSPHEPSPRPSSAARTS